MMVRELLEMVERRAHSLDLRDKSATNQRHAVKMLTPVFDLGIRAASVGDTWIRHAERRIDEGLKPSTMRQRFDCAAALLGWVIHADIKMKSASPGSLGRIMAALREAARHINKRIKRHRAMSKTARVSIDEYRDVVGQIEAMPRQHSAAAKMMICFGLRASEALSLSEASIINSESGYALFIPGRETKTHADLFLPLPPKYIETVRGWLKEIGEKEIKYNTFYTSVTRSGNKWRGHDLRKIFRTMAAVNGGDYLATELILNHAVKDVPAVYLQHPPYAAMRKVLENSIDSYLEAAKAA
nr:integrase [Kosakonia sacchari]